MVSSALGAGAAKQRAAEQYATPSAAPPSAAPPSAAPPSPSRGGDDYGYSNSKRRSDKPVARAKAAARSAASVAHAEALFPVVQELVRLAAGGPGQVVVRVSPRTRWENTADNTFVALGLGGQPQVQLPAEDAVEVQVPASWTAEKAAAMTRQTNEP